MWKAIKKEILGEDDEDESDDEVNNKVIVLG